MEYWNGGYVNSSDSYLVPPGSGGFYQITGGISTITLTGSEAMKLTGKKFGVVSRATGGIVEVHDSKDDALAAAKRLAAKEMDEYFVFASVATVRPKPVDVEVVEG
jgi:hypothetical protein